MQIAIQGHSKRGKEVIQILESLGGKSREELTGRRISQYYFINCNGDIDLNLKINLLNHKLYTLEEFEKEFPFKIGDEVIFPVKTGWASGIVTGLTYVEGQLKYEVDHRIAGYCYIEPHKLSLYPMKEERNIKLTLDKAKEWYKKGGELKEIALQAFTEKELNPLPRSWEEFCTNYSIQDGEAIIDEQTSQIRIYKGVVARCLPFDKNICPSKKSAEAHLAMIQLEQLRNCWWSDWKPEWNASHKYAIKNLQGEIAILGCSNVAAFLVFPTIEMAEEFFECFRDLIEKAGDLI